VLLVCGFLLLLPGFFTDIIGFLALVPAIRKWAILVFLRRARIMQPPPRSYDEAETHRPHIIEGEFRRDDD
jgi:UPF0716 protein FxsA